MKLNKLSLSLAITLALGSTFGMAQCRNYNNYETPVVTNVQKHLHILQLLQKQLLRQHMQKQLLRKLHQQRQLKSTTTTDKTTTTAKSNKNLRLLQRLKKHCQLAYTQIQKDNWARDAIQANDRGWLLIRLCR